MKTLAEIRWIVLLAPLMIGLLPTASLADVHEGSDVLGLTTLPNENGVFFLENAAPGPFDLHLVVFGYQYAQGIVGWDCRVDVPAGVDLLDVAIQGKYLDYDPDPAAFEVFLAIPLLPADEIVHLATLHLWNTDETEKDFFLSPHIGAMDFALESSSGTRLPFQWPNDCDECPVFELKKSVEAAESATWDAVKSLYRR